MKEKLIEKSQLKRDNYKIFGMPMTTFTEERDTNIYNDYEFYQNMLKDFLASSGEVEEENQLNGGEDEYLEGADIGLTQRYLQKRQKMKDDSAKEKKKEIDRKASKNRKIRYIVHEKLVNFMTPNDNEMFN